MEDVEHTSWRGFGVMVFNTTFNSRGIKNGGIYDTQRINGTIGIKIMV